MDTADFGLHEQLFGIASFQTILNGTYVSIRTETVRGFGSRISTPSVPMRQNLNAEKR